MRAIDITVYYSTLRTEALERILGEQGTTLDSAVAELLDELYQKTVPLQERNEIEQRIRQEEAQTTADAEASRRFGVFHIREQGEDCYFTSELQKDLYQTACVCRGYLQAGGQSLLCDCFNHKQTLSYPAYTDRAVGLGYDPRITMLVELDADKGVCMVQASGDDSWHQYKLKDLSTAIYHAKRKEGRTFSQRDEVFREFIAGREIPLEAPDYCCSDQLGKPAVQRVAEFNAANAPFRLMDFEDGHYSLSLNISFLVPPYTNYGQQAFDAYAELGGAPAQQNGLFVRGSGYDWESVFQKAFESDPRLKAVRFDSEAGGFYCYSEDLSVLEDLGSRFRELCQAPQKFQETVCAALKEADQRQQMQWGGM
ncbi:MAG: hypothetical protein IJZ39_08030 [Oscillospiraceae bacterium]|nr:hypothetical protein [Oscillospiraceae bacterium]